MTTEPSLQERFDDVIRRLDEPKMGNPKYGQDRRRIEGELRQITRELLRAALPATQPEPSRLPSVVDITGVGPIRAAVVVEMENEGVVTWGDDRHRARFLATPEPDRPTPDRREECHPGCDMCATLNDASFYHEREHALAAESTGEAEHPANYKGLHGGTDRRERHAGSDDE